MTCDAHRKNIPLTVDPFDIYLIRKLCHTSDGYITSDDIKIKTDVEETLNLNCKASSLPENRKMFCSRQNARLEKICGNKSHDTYLAFLEKVHQRYVEQRMLTPLLWNCDCVVGETTRYKLG